MTILNLVFNPPVHFKPVIRSRQSIRARSFESLMMLCCEWDEFSLCCVLYFSILASSKCPSAAACLHSCYVLSTENGVRESREILCRENEMWSHRPESEKGLTRGVGKSITNLFWNKDLWQSRASLGYFIICYIYIYIVHWTSFGDRFCRTFKIGELHEDNKLKANGQRQQSPDIAHQYYITKDSTWLTPQPSTAEDGLCTISFFLLHHT